LARESFQSIYPQDEAGKIHTLLLTNPITTDNSTNSSKVYLSTKITRKAKSKSHTLKEVKTEMSGIFFLLLGGGTINF